MPARGKKQVYRAQGIPTGAEAENVLVAYQHYLLEEEKTRTNDAEKVLCAAIRSKMSSSEQEIEIMVEILPSCSSTEYEAPEACALVYFASEKQQKDLIPHFLERKAGFTGECTICLEYEDEDYFITIDNHFRSLTQLYHTPANEPIVAE